MLPIYVFKLFVLVYSSIYHVLVFSFLDNAFRKNLESALRFGNPLLVQDVESYDPILNPVLNKEVRKTGGRVLITLGDQDIDLSPAFTIFLSTRDPTVSTNLFLFFGENVCYEYVHRNNAIRKQWSLLRFFVS